MGLAQRQSYFTPEEYLAFEREAKTKHEYVNGQIYAMAGASPEYNQITFNTTVAIGIQIKGRSCRGYSADQKVRTDPQSLFSYPDSTESYDRGEKFAHYRTIESLTDYLLIAQDRPCVEHFTRQKGKRPWLYNVETELTGSLWIESIKCELKLADIYDLVNLPTKHPLLFEVVLKLPKPKTVIPKSKKSQCPALSSRWCGSSVSVVFKPHLLHRLQPGKTSSTANHCGAGPRQI